MEPTIYKPSIYKGAGIYKTGAEGGGGGGYLPEGYKKFSFIRNKIEINSTSVSSYIHIDKDLNNENKIIGFEAAVSLYNGEYASIFRSLNNTGCDFIIQNQYGSIAAQFNNGNITTGLTIFSDNVGSIIGAGIYNDFFKNLYSKSDNLIPGIYESSQTGGFLIGGARYNKATPAKAFNLSRFFVYDKSNENFLIDCVPAKKDENGQIGLFDIVDKIFYTADISSYELLGVDL